MFVDIEGNGRNSRFGKGEVSEWFRRMKRVVNGVLVTRRKAAVCLGSQVQAFGADWTSLLLSRPSPDRSLQVRLSCH